jgi:fermentation-respiration switch protein FrsA (DUF1100 family)
MSAISIKKGLVQLAGLLFAPANITTKSAALIIMHPGGGVKEQTASLYARKLASHGFTTIAYDASHQGASGGEPRYLEDPSQRISDVYAVVDYLQQLDSVDAEKIGLVGICAGGGYAVGATKSDYRIKALATVSMANNGDALRKGWNGDQNPKNSTEGLWQAAKQMKSEAAGAEAVYIPYVPPTLDADTPHDLVEAHHYYLEPPFQHSNSPNKMLLSSVPLVLNFDAFEMADLYLVRPTLIIAGNKAGSKWHSDRLAKILDEKSEQVTLEGATHMDLYWKEEYVNPAVEKIAAFMKRHL